MAPLQESYPCEDAAPQTPRPAPRGRPPRGYVWSGHGYIHRDSLAPFSHTEHEASMKEAWRELRLLRHREDVRGFRTKRVEDQAKSRLAAGAKPRSKKLKNAILVRSPVHEVNRCTGKSSTQ